MEPITASYEFRSVVGARDQLSEVARRLVAGMDEGRVREIAAEGAVIEVTVRAKVDDGNSE